MKIIYCLLVLTLGIAACDSILKKSNTKEKESNTIEKEIATVYNKKGDNILYIQRFMTDGSKYWSLSFRVTTDTFGIVQQDFTEKRNYNSEDDLKKSKLQLSDYDWQPWAGQKVLFVQIQPEAFESEMDALEKRGPVETTIDAQLKDKALGEWIAGDIGPGGANMLFVVTNEAKAMGIIIGVLKEEKIETKTVIARRLNTSDEDWLYEIIFPQQFTGYFNTF